MLWHPRGVSSLDPETGAVYWEHEWPIGGMTVATPVSRGPYLLVTHFFRGSLMLRLDSDRPAAEELWRGQSRSELPGQTDGLHALITTPLIIGDYVYGVGSYGELRCLDARTGERVWETTELVGPERWGAAFFVQHGDRVFVTNDTGELILARLTPEGYTEIGRTQLLAPATRTRGGATGRWGDRGVVWSHPAYANRRRARAAGPRGDGGVALSGARPDRDGAGGGRVRPDQLREPGVPGTGGGGAGV